MRAPATAVVALAALLPGSTAFAEVPVHMHFETFAPRELDVLPGETVAWHNMSSRAHTVTADDDSFDSGDIEAGDDFEMAFDAVGSYGYHCRLHLGMVGEVDVRRVTMGTLPPGLVEAGERIAVDGRAADPSVPVEVERSTADGFETVATVMPNADGTWQGEVVAERTADYRARAGTDVSDVRRLLVSDRRVIVRARRGGVQVRVVPPDPNGRVMLELRLRERFGWWPQAFKRLDYLSRASFRVNRSVPARVSVVGRDGWTRMAISRVVRVKPPRR